MINKILEYIKTEHDEEMTADTDFRETSIDSLDLIVIMMWAEEEFSVEITDEEGDKVLTPNDMVELIKEKQNGK